GGFFSGTLFLGAFESLGAGLALFGVVAGFALQKAGGIEETLDAIGRLGAVLEPVGDTLAIDHDALFVALFQHLVVRTDALDDAAVTRRAGVGDDDVVVGALLGAGASQADLYCHCFGLSSLGGLRSYFFLPGRPGNPGSPGNFDPPSPGSPGMPPVPPCLTSLEKSSGNWEGSPPICLAICSSWAGSMSGMPPPIIFLPMPPNM